MDRPSRTVKMTASRGALLSFMLAIAIMATMGLCTAWGYAYYLRLVSSVQRTHDVLYKIYAIRKVIGTAQSGERGYVLTGDPRSLVLYDGIVPRFEENFAALLDVIGDNPLQVARAEFLKPKMLASLNEISEVIELRRKGRFDDAALRLRAGKTQSSVDEIRHLIDEMEAEENHLLDIRAADAREFSMHLRNALILGFSFGVLLLLISAMIVMRTLKGRERAEAELSRFFASSADMFCVAGFDGMFHRLNSQFTEVLGHSPAELRAKPIRDFLHPDDVASTSKEIARIGDGAKMLVFENRFRCKDGSYKWLSWRAIPIPEEGLIDCVARDVTDRKKMEKENLDAQKAAQAANEAKSQFLANMSHEIRTPMNGVIGMTKILLDSPLSPDQKDSAKSILSSAQSLLHIINDILDFSKIEAGKMDLEVMEFDLDQLLNEVEKSFVFAVSHKSIVFQVRPSQLRYMIKGDPSRLRQILLNLVGNAVKFTQRGSVAVSSRVVHGAANTRLRFSVSDTGIGIPKRAVDQMFQPFSQADSSTSRKFGGTGLGLSICKQLVELMGGTIGVTSVEGEGSVFWFELPFEVGGQIEKPTDEVQRSARPRISGRVLIAEDNQINQKIIRRVLEKMGCKTHVVANGAEAIAALSEIAYDLVLMDCQMPEMDGYEATEKIRHSGKAWNRIPIVAMTANAMAGDEARCLSIGMNGYLSKPLDEAKVYDVLTKYLKRTDPSMERPVGSLNLKTLLELESLQSDGEPDIVLDLIQTFLTDTPKRMRTIEKGGTDGNFKSVRQSAHQMKSGARMLGAAGFGEICQQIEDLPETATGEQYMTLYRRLNDELEKLVGELNDAAAQRAKKAA